MDIFGMDQGGHMSPEKLKEKNKHHSELKRYSDKYNMDIE